MKKSSAVHSFHLLPRCVLAGAVLGLTLLSRAGLEGRESPGIVSATAGDCQKHVVFTVEGLPEGTVLLEFPVLVRLSTAIEGFSYSDFRSEDGSDLIFLGADGIALPYEIDTWDAAGTSLVWVRLPSAEKGTTFELYYGTDGSVSNSPSGVWTGYAGVWHLNEAAGTSADSSPNGNAGTDRANVASVASGAVGRAKRTSKEVGKSDTVGAGVRVAQSDSLKVAPALTMSMWYRPTAKLNDCWSYLFAAKNKDAVASWGAQWRNGSLAVATGGSTEDLAQSPAFAVPTAQGAWTKLDVTISSRTVSVYTNGALSATKDSTVALADGNGLALGSMTDNGYGAFVGELDEVRLRPEAVDAAWIAADYATQSAADFLSCGPVRETDATRAVIVERPTLSRASDGTVTLSATVSGTVGTTYSLSASCNGDLHDLGSWTATEESPTHAIAEVLDVEPDRTCEVVLSVANGISTTAARCPETFLSGDVSVVKVADAQEKGCVEGAFRVSRPDGSGQKPLVVKYRLSSPTATPGVSYEIPAGASRVGETLSVSGRVTIPAGETSASVPVKPVVDPALQEDATLTLELEPGLYGVSASAGSAALLLVNLATDADSNTWVAPAAGRASEAGNWSQGVPQAGQRILFDGRFPTADCEWDAGVGGLTDTVASWTQTADYSGTVTFDMTYPEADSLFEKLTVTGDCTIGGGAWTHAANSNGAVQNHRLRVDVGGAFVLSAGAKVDLFQKGLPVDKFRAGSARGVHGGSRTDFSQVHGSVYAPYDVGNGGLTTGFGTRSPGGGALWLEVAGAATVDGLVTVRAWADSGNGWAGPASGAPGSIYIKAASLSGAGRLDASATDYDRGASGAPSGGRVALVLTASDELGLPLANVSALGALSGGCAGCGTIFVKTANQANGTLVLRNRMRPSRSVCGILPHGLGAVTPIPVGETWRFDAVVLQDHGVLAVPADATLELPSGFASVSGNSALDGARNVNRSGILYLGGVITASDAAEAVIANGWVFQAQEPYAFPGNVTVRDGAAIGDIYFASSTSLWSRCDVSVAGNLTVEATGWLYARNSGVTQSSSAYTDPFQYLGGFYAHAGALALKAGENLAYGSALHPCTPGTFGYGDDTATMSPAGGVVRISVGGDLVLDGKADASSEPWSSQYDSRSGGSGGSLDITCATLSGTGSICANGATNHLGSADEQYGKKAFTACGAGGRVAVRLTAPDATFAAFGTDRIQAFGASSGDLAHKGMFAGAGTVYLQDGKTSEGAGVIRVRNDGCADNAGETAVPAARLADGAEALRETALEVSGRAHVLAGADLRLRQVELEEGCTINIAGRKWAVGSLRVAGRAVAGGTYTASSGVDWLTDSSEGASGEVTVSGGFCVIVR